MSRKQLAVAGFKGLAVGVLAVDLPTLTARLLSTPVPGGSDPCDSVLCRTGWGSFGLSSWALLVLAGILVLGPLAAWALRLREPYLYAFFVVIACVGVVVPVPVTLGVLLVGYPALAMRLARENAPVAVGD